MTEGERYIESVRALNLWRPEGFGDIWELTKRYRAAKLAEYAAAKKAFRERNQSK